MLCSSLLARTFLNVAFQMYSEGSPFVAQDNATAFRYFSLAAEKVSCLLLKGMPFALKIDISHCAHHHLSHHDDHVRQHHHRHHHNAHRWLKFAFAQSGAVLCFVTLALRVLPVAVTCSPNLLCCILRYFTDFAFCCCVI